MPTYSDDLLRTGRLLLSRQSDAEERLPSARVRRSVSTCYYALFHFLLAECAGEIVGKGDALERRRHIYMRVVAHRGLRLTMAKVSGAAPATDISEFLVPHAVTPPFAREVASAFQEAYDKRQSADYDLNAELSELEAALLIERVEAAIRMWQAADTDADRDFKHALAMLVMLQGRLRADNG